MTSHHCPQIPKVCELESAKLCNATALGIASLLQNYAELSSPLSNPQLVVALREIITQLENVDDALRRVEQKDDQVEGEQ